MVGGCDLAEVQPELRGRRDIVSAGFCRGCISTAPRCIIQVTIVSQACNELLR
jgi:hypothetical protein